MPDGQEKSDDLIAELAKLMASGAGGAEPEAKPAPRLVTLGDNSKPLGPGPGSIRVPGMDAPIAPMASERSAAPPVLRIPGMDQPVAATPAPFKSITPTSVEVPAEPKPAASFDFGILPPAGALKPEPLANWQDREVPKPVSVRPASIEPVSAPPAPSFAPPSPSVVAVAAPTAKPLDVQAIVDETLRVEPSLGAPRPLSAEPLVTSAKPQPEGDAFNFDFGFGAAPPAPIEAGEPRAARPSTGDPIADLIAADLDAPIQSEDEPALARPAPPPQPAARPFPQPAPQRPLSNLPVRPVPARATEPDRMTSAPVFASSNRPAAPAERDPMEEIESLIGEAVRVELSNTERPAVQPLAAPPIAHQSAPVVPPLTTGFAPRRAALKDNDSHVPSAEAAILAAAAAAGAETGRIEGNVTGDSSPYKRPRAKPEKRSFFAGGMRQYVGMAVAGTLLLAAGFGLYWVLGMGRANDADAPVLQADATPVKETPPAATTPTDTQGSVVFNEMDGVKTDPNEQLVSRDSTADTPVADVARTVGDEGDAASESELANRKVRTVTVRPDGTIVSGDEAVAGSEALPVDRPNVPDLPGGDVQPSELLAAVPTNDTPAPAIVTAPAVAEPAPNPNTVIDASIVAPVPAARPTDRSVLGGGANARKVAAVAAVDNSAPLDLVPATNNNAAPAVVSGSGGAYVQLSSQRSEADAQASLRTTKNRLGSSLNDAGLEIRRVDLGAKGIWYRVVLPTGSFQNATQTCASMKANGVDCVAIGG